MKLRHAEIVCEDGAHMVTWLQSSLCRKGQHLEDAATGRRWRVLVAYALEIERDDIAHGWKVGGLE